jgi:hypothetical protein
METERNRRTAKCIVELESRRYLFDIGLLKNLDVHYSMPVARYILSSCACLPVKTVIVGERPYATDIHPYISSAMSYDPSKSRATPSTVGMATDMTSNFSTTYLEVETWFRDGWKHLASGVLLLNCNTFLQFSSSRSQSETVPFQKWLRSILDCSMLLSNDKIDVVCMGIPSQNVVDSLLRSIGTARMNVNKKFCSNPASIVKQARSDTRSLSGTLGNKSASRSVLSAITRSRNSRTLSVDDYFDILSPTMSAQIPQVGKLIQAANDIASQIDDAYKEMEGNHKLPAVKDAIDSFVSALVEYRDSVLKDIVMSSMVAAGDNSGKVAKATEWGNKKPWQKAPTSTGANTRMSVVTEDAGGVAQKFEDDADEPVTFADESETEKVKVESAPKKKKKVLRKVVKSKKPSGTGGVDTRTESTAVGSKLNDAGIAALRSISYFISDVYPGSSKSLESAVIESIKTLKVVDDDVSLMLDVASRDFETTGSTAAASLGIDDGMVSEVCGLPMVIEKLVASRV